MSSLCRVLIIGGYGNFGQFISKRLSVEPNLQLIVSGRSLEKAENLVSDLEGANRAEAYALDIRDPLETHLDKISPNVVVHTSGPFQQQGYEVAEACIKYGCHYIDLADGRAFVAGISSLDAKAKESGVLVVSGASSVPCLTSALLDHFQHEFKEMRSVSYGITTAQKTTRGLATTAAILGYTGRPFKTLIEGEFTDQYGWQSLFARRYKGLGWRLLSSCDVPDLALFPARYPSLKSIRFYAGLEIKFIHMTLWMISWLVRIGLVRDLSKYAAGLLKASFLFDWLGTDVSAFHMEVVGRDHQDQPCQRTFELIARSGHGPYIPCMPSILLVKHLASGALRKTGAMPCMGLISKEDYLSALGGLDIVYE